MSIYEFTFPYQIDGKTAAEFEARVYFKGIVEYDGEGEITVIDEVEIDVGSWDAISKQHMDDWVSADLDLGGKITAWLWQNMETVQGAMVEILRDDNVVA